ncbi:uncharacterized protein SCHCODRAFT_02625543 [Schizophyllum commune H4-8]|uniref:uncharacterized protein n=1 Tax=Schizophyllum commune (strain H4-8 / FGSC 9210) TaxID=578458 RepID=UPI002160718E|nr:uncharacterized protein SCHCODRAFT_02625543 [Schizophyllum commune H4-8]KAI5892198.1 hypothetical protein SCHCODRAFT_02625543 [Schizophyllum commune H4-8]
MMISSALISWRVGLLPSSGAGYACRKRGQEASSVGTSLRDGANSMVPSVQFNQAMRAQDSVVLTAGTSTASG